METLRRCSHAGCRTVLTIYNTGTKCYRHKHVVPIDVEVKGHGVDLTGCSESTMRSFLTKRGMWDGKRRKCSKPGQHPEFIKALRRRRQGRLFIGAKRRTKE